jgi:DNA-binding XRE family transcriptional regulator
MIRAMFLTSSYTSVQLREASAGEAIWIEERIRNSHYAEGVDLGAGEVSAADRTGVITVVFQEQGIGLTKANWATWVDGQKQRVRLGSNVLVEPDGRWFEISPSNRDGDDDDSEDVAPQRIITSGAEDVALFILKEWYAQRNDWVVGRIRSPGHHLANTGKVQFLHLAPDSLQEYLYPGQQRPKNWRQHLYSRLWTLAHVKKRVPPRPEFGPVEVLIDGRRLMKTGPAQGCSWEEALFSALEGAEPEFQNGFFVQLSRPFEGTLLYCHPFVPKPGEQVEWGSQALKLRAQCLKDEGLPPSEIKAQLSRYRDRAITYDHHPGLRSYGNLAEVRWSDSQKRLLEVLLSERTKGRKRPNQRFKPPEVALARDGEVACNGSGGTGYSLGVWLERAGSGTDPSPSALLTFLMDVEALQRTLGVTVRSKSGLTNGDLLAELRYRAGGRGRKHRRPWTGEILYFFLPVGFEQVYSDRLEQVRTETSGREPSPWHPARLQRQREARGLTQQVLANHLGLGRANIAQWENGSRPVPRKYWETLTALL